MSRRFVRSSTVLLPVVLTASLLGSALVAQCSTQWLPGNGLPGTDLEMDASFQRGVHAMTAWDPDGPGPVQPRLVLGGVFSIAGNVQAERIVACDPATGTWSALGAGMNGRVTSLATMANGDLVAGGQFTSAGGVSANSIARWNGTAWSSLGTGMNGYVYSMAILPNGDLVAGGDFSSAGGVSANSIARWNGSAWAPFGTGVNNLVMALATRPDGTLFAGGHFTTAGGVAANYIAQWNGMSWSPLGPGLGSGIQSLAVLPNGNVVAGTSWLEQWDGTAWSPLGSWQGSAPLALVSLPGGGLAATGGFVPTGGGQSEIVMRWDGSAWIALGSSMTTTSWLYTAKAACLAVLPSGELVAGGDFERAGGVTAWGVARWQGANWAPLAAGTDGSVGPMLVCPNGDVVASGGFTVLAGSAIQTVARWNGAAWSAMGGAFSSPPGSPGSGVSALASLVNGDVIAGGFFTTAGTASAHNLARWNGATWLPMGSGFTGPPFPWGSLPYVSALASMPNGDLIVGGYFTTASGVSAQSIARLSGGVWSALATGLGGAFGLPGNVREILELPNGDLVVGGDFTTAGGVSVANIACWDGVSWSAMGPGLLGSVGSLVTLTNGDLVAGGSFPGGVAQWNGTTWTALGGGVSGVVYSLAVRTNGDLVVGGSFTNAGATSANNIAIWNGTSWSAMGSGTSDSVGSIANLPNGELMVGGAFRIVDGAVSAYFARMSGCSGVAQARSYGAGCYTTYGAYAQSFPASTFDLGGSASTTVTVNHVPTANGYMVQAGNSAWFAPVAANLGLTDDSVSATLTLPFPFNFPGGSTSQVRMCSNGYLWLNGFTTTVDVQPTVSTLVAGPARLAPLWMDLDPSAGGTCHYDIDPSNTAVYFTWDDVPHYGTSIGNTCQLVLRNTGAVEYRYRTIGSQVDACLVGRSRGVSGVPNDTDISAAMPFSVTVDGMPLAFGAANRPILGGTFTANLTNVPNPAGSVGLVLTDFVQLDPGVNLASIGAPGCFLYNPASVIEVLFPLTAVTPWSLSIPNVPSLANVHVFAQGAVLVPPGTNAFGALTTNGLDLVLGSY